MARYAELIAILHSRYQQAAHISCADICNRHGLSYGQNTATATSV